MKSMGVLSLMVSIATGLGGVAVLPAAGAQPAVAPALHGYLAAANGDWEGAVRAFREAISADPYSAELRAVAADLLASSGKVPEALEIVEQGLDVRPGQATLLLLKARFLDLQGKRREAAVAAVEAAKKEETAQAYSLAIRLLDATGQASAAEELAVAWASKNAKSGEPQFVLGQLALRRGDKAKAREAFAQALQLAPDNLASARALAQLEQEAGNRSAAEELYRKVIEANPHDLDARFRLGELLIRQSRVDEAKALFKDVARWSGNDRDAMLRLAMLLLEADRAADAEAVARPLTESQPEDGTAWYVLGASLEAQQKYEEALTAFSRIPEDSSEYVDALIRRAVSLQGLKRGAEGRALLSDWLRGHPESEEVALALAEISEDPADLRRAVAVLEELAGRKPTPKIYFVLGVYHDKLKDWKKSADYMKRSLELDPDDAHALNYLGYTYADQGVNLEEAEKLILRAVSLRPNDGAITDSLGWVYFKQGRFADAVGELRKAVELSPKDAVIWEHLGDALKAHGEAPGASEAYKKALELDPDSGAKTKREEVR